ncbi:MAG TPA: GNAT family N-acetyltransferase [Mucilaginibacter sp.]|jgi:GNAT superfamily N-acetyltransferase|nr:GNAT family N-acetyltransferase [Mucilaginibacter sp.]
MIDLKRTNSQDADFQALISELDANLREIYDRLMDVYDPHNIIEDVDTVVIAYQDGEPVGCGCFKHFNEDAAEIKRMYVRKTCRGQGISGLILTELEAWAKEKRFIVAILETGERNLEALGLYRKAGYSPMPNYGPYVNLKSSFCFRKRL